MPFLFIGSTGDHAGQTLVAWSIARRLQDKGVRVGFFKPFGAPPVKVHDGWADPDAFLFKKALRMEEPLDSICPYMLPEHYMNPNMLDPKMPDPKMPDNMIEEITSLAIKLSKGKDLLVIIGSKHIFFDDAPHPVPDLSIISELKADMCLVHRYKKVSTTLYSILSVNSLLKDCIKGTIINRIPHIQLQEARDQIGPVFSQKGITNIGFLPEDPTLSLWNIGQIRDILKGQVLWGEEFLDRPVEGLTVGTSNLQGELKIFKRVYNKVILIGPSATSPVVAGILLTGNREPGRRVLEAAGRSGIPLILVQDDAFSVKERLEQYPPTLTPEDEDKINYFTALMDRHNLLNGIIRSLGWD